VLNNPQIRRLILFVALISAVVTGAALANISYARNNPGGTDFVIQWTAIRAFLIDGSSPYSDAATLEIQTNITGGVDSQGESAYRFTEPFYSLALYAPFSAISDFEIARGLWMTVIEICLAGIAYFGLKLIKRRAPFWLAAVSFILVMLSFNGIRSIVNGNDAILVTMLLAIGLLAIVNKNDELAGVLLAFATIRPLLVGVVIGFILLWAVFQHRSTIIYWFLGTLVLLAGFSMLLIPDWVIQNFRAFISSVATNPPGSPGALMVHAWGDIGLRLAVFLCVAIGGILLLEWIHAFRGDTKHMVWTVFLTAALCQWIGIPTRVENFVLLYPGILFCFGVLLQRWGGKVRMVVQGIAAVLIAVTWVLGLSTGMFGSRSAENPVGFFILPLVSILLLYWTKWWTIRSAGNQEIR